MFETLRIAPAAPIPAIVLPPRCAPRVRDADPLPRLARIACALAALALPALGIAAADSVHRAGAPGATQAAAPQSPSAGAAAFGPDARRGGRP